MTKIDNILAKLPLKTRAVVVVSLLLIVNVVLLMTPKTLINLFVDYLKKVWKNSLSFHKIIHEMFEGNMNDPSFVRWLAAK